MPLGSRTRATLSILLAAVVALAVPAAARGYTGATTFDGTPLRWWGSCVLWTMTEQSLDQSVRPDAVQPFIPFEELREEVRGSFEVWDEVDCSYLRLIESEPGRCLDVGLHRSAGNANRVLFRSSGWVDSISPWRQPGQIALTSVFYDTETGEILDVDIEVNAEHFELTTTLEAPVTDIRNALTHEVGHLIGLDHSSRPDATMWPSANPGETSKRTLSDDDVAGICALYPLESDPGVCEGPLGGLDPDCETAAACSEPVDDLLESCWFDELVCCCERAGGLGRCEWAASPGCAAGGRFGVLEVDPASACSGERPSRLSVCCCQLRSEGIACEWRGQAECEREAGLPTTALTAADLCGPVPAERGCHCGAPRPATAGGALARLARAAFAFLAQ